MTKDTSGPAFPADIPRINTVKSLSPALVTLDAIRRIVREELRADAALEAAARQALEALELLLKRVKTGYDGMPQGYGVRAADEAVDALRTALKEKA